MPVSPDKENVASSLQSPIARVEPPAKGSKCATKVASRPLPSRSCWSARRFAKDRYAVQVGRWHELSEQIKFVLANDDRRIRFGNQVYFNGQLMRGRVCVSLDARHRRLALIPQEVQIDRMKQNLSRGRDLPH